MIVTASRKTFPGLDEREDAVATIRRISGRVIRKNAEVRLQPSTSAASSS